VCLQALSTTDYRGIEQVHLLGGAVDINGEMWRESARAVKGPIRNYTSDNDMVLKTLYRVGSFFASEPIGTNPIDTPQVKNIDVSDCAGGHMESKNMPPASSTCRVTDQATKTDGMLALCYRSSGMDPRQGRALPRRPCPPRPDCRTPLDLCRPG
jgi:hypothetical protein